VLVLAAGRIGTTRIVNRSPLAIPATGILIIGLFVFRASDFTDTEQTAGRGENVLNLSVLRVFWNVIKAPEGPRCAAQQKHETMASDVKPNTIGRRE